MLGLVTHYFPNFKPTFVLENATKRDNAGAVCNSGMSKLFLMHLIFFSYFLGWGGVRNSTSSSTEPDKANLQTQSSDPNPVNLTSQISPSKPKPDPESQLKNNVRSNLSWEIN